MEKQIGAEGKFGIELADGKLKLSGGYDGKGLDASAVIAVDGDYFVDKLMEVIPGDSPFETAMGAALKIALKAVKV